LIGLLSVCLGAAVGAPARYLVDRAIQARHDALVPWGTLSVNVVGSLVLGVLAGLTTRYDVPAELSLAIGTGFCGALTTYSTFGYETWRLVEDGARLVAFFNMAASLAIGLAAAALGYAVGTVF
jgi:fluoride exporter